MTKTMERVKISAPAERQIRYQREFDAPLDKVWRAFEDAELVKQWWGRGREMTVEKHEFRRGGYWRYVVPGSSGKPEGFNGRYREIVPRQRIVNTFEWDGMPGYVWIETTVFSDLGDGRTRIETTSLFHTAEEAEGVFASGMEAGLNDAFAALTRLLATL